jgi:hypothetical protein
MVALGFECLPLPPECCLGIFQRLSGLEELAGKGENILPRRILQERPAEDHLQRLFWSTL